LSLVRWAAIAAGARAPFRVRDARKTVGKSRLPPRALGKRPPAARGGTRDRRDVFSRRGSRSRSRHRPSPSPPPVAAADPPPPGPVPAGRPSPSPWVSPSVGDAATSVTPVPAGDPPPPGPVSSGRPSLSPWVSPSAGDISVAAVAPPISTVQIRAPSCGVEPPVGGDSPPLADLTHFREWSPTDLTDSCVSDAELSSGQSRASLPRSPCSPVEDLGRPAPPEVRKWPRATHRTAAERGHRRIVRQDSTYSWEVVGYHDTFGQDTDCPDDRCVQKFSPNQILFSTAG
jgi:hypothetical protein